MKWTSQTQEQFMYNLSRAELRKIQRFSQKRKIKRPRLVTESIRLVSESLIWADQHEAGNTLDHFNSLLHSYHTHSEITKQLLQTATLLIHNFSSQESLGVLYIGYLLRHEFFSDLIMLYFDLQSGELIEFYVSLLRTMSINLSKELLEEFLIRCDLSLLKLSGLFVFYHEAMARTASRSAVLTMISLENPEIRHSVLESGFIPEFIQTMRLSMFALDKKIQHVEASDREISDMVDDLYYIQDLFELEIEEYSRELVSEFLGRLLLPCVLGSLAIDIHNEHHLSIPLASFILANTVSVIKHPVVTNTLTSLLLLTHVSPKLIQLAWNPPPDPILPQNQNFFEDCSEKSPENPIKDTFIGLLSSKDDNMVGLTLLTLQGIHFNPSIDQKLLAQSKETDLGRYVEIMLDLLRNGSHFRVITCKLIANQLVRLAPDKLTEEQLSSLKTSYQEAAQRTLETIEITNDMSRTLKAIETQHQKVSLLSFTEKGLCLSVFLLPMNAEINDYPQEYDIPYTGIDETIRNVYLLFMLRKLNAKYHSSKAGPEGQVFTQPTLTVGAEFNYEGLNVYQCTFRGKKAVLVEPEDCLILVEPKHEKTGTVVFVVKLRSVQIMDDRNNKTVEIQVEKRRSFETVEIGFQLPRESTRVRRVLLDTQTSSIQFELAMFKSLLRSIIES